MHYLVMNESLQVQQILEANDIEYEVTTSGELYTAYCLDTLYLLDDYGIVSHTYSWSEIINTNPGYKIQDWI
jgi:hypothetical protein